MALFLFVFVPLLLAQDETRRAEEQAAAIARAQQQVVAAQALQELFELAARLKGQSSRDEDTRSSLVALIDHLRDPSPVMRSTAAACLGSAGPAAAAAALALRASLRDPDVSVRVAAAAALVDVGAGSDDLLPVLREGIDRPDLQAIAAAGRLGEVAQPLLAPLMAAARKATDPGFASVLRQAVERIDTSRLPAFDRTVAAAQKARAERLVGELRSMNTAWPAHQSLVALGRPAVASLVSLLQEGSQPSLPRAAQMGPAIGSNGGGVAIIAAGDIADLPRWHAVGVLGEMGPAAAAAVPSLARIAVDRTDALTVRVAAIEALGRIRSRPAEALPALTDALQDGSPVSAMPPAGVFAGGSTIRGMAAHSLGLFGHEARSAAPRLREAEVQESSPAMVAAIRQALDRVSRPSADQLAALAADREASAVNGIKHFGDPVTGIEFEYPERYRAKELRAPDGDLGGVGLQVDDSPFWDFDLDVEEPDGFTSLEGGNLEFGVRRALLHCSADGPEGSVDCPRVLRRIPLKTRSGLKAMQAVLLEEEDRGGAKTTRERSTFVVDISTPQRIRVLLLAVGGAGAEAANATSLRDIALSVRLASTPGR